MYFASCTIIRITSNDFSKIYKVELLCFFFVDDKEFGVDSQNLCYKDESNYTAIASKVKKNPSTKRKSLHWQYYFFFY